MKTRGADNIAKTTRAICGELRRALPILGITHQRRGGPFHHRHAQPSQECRERVGHSFGPLSRAVGDGESVGGTHATSRWMQRNG